MRSADFIITPRITLPHVILDGGVWHCDGRLFDPDSMTLEALQDEANFWLALTQYKHEEMRR